MVYLCPPPGASIKVHTFYPAIQKHPVSPKVEVAPLRGIEYSQSSW
jgi:hypothetical protein